MKKYLRTLLPNSISIETVALLLNKIKFSLLLSLFLLLALANKTDAQPALHAGNSNKTLQLSSHTQSGAVKWTAGQESMPGNLQAFQENKGQFPNLTNNGWKVLYGADYDGCKILFTDHGVIYTMPEAVKDSSDEGKDKTSGKIEEEKEKKHKQNFIYRNVSIEWKNANARLMVEAQNETPYYFGSLNPQDPKNSPGKIKGFGKLVYHNVYPGIDVEYTFHAGKGIKYSITVHPGAKASDIKLLYKGQKGLSVDNNGDVHIGTELGEIIDHAPLSFQKGQNKVESSFKKTGDNELAFQVGKTDPTSDLVIDPWIIVVSPLPTVGNFLPTVLGMDASDNVYIYGYDNGNPDQYVQKYSSTGILQWTQVLSQYATYVATDGRYIAGFAVDNIGNTYIAGIWGPINAAGGSYSMLSYDPADNERYFYDTYPQSAGDSPGSMFDLWNLTYSCEYNEVIEGGAPNYWGSEEVGAVNPSNGTLTSEAIHVSGAGWSSGEIFTGCIAPNGNYYGIACYKNTTSSGQKWHDDTLVEYTLAAGTAAYSWAQDLPKYHWNDFDTKNPNGVAANHIGAGCSNLYTTNGLMLDQRSLVDGSLIKSINLPLAYKDSIPDGGGGKFYTSGGIGVDVAAGNVYAGDSNTVQVYDQNLNSIASHVGLPGNVYDVRYNNGLVAACGGVFGFGQTPTGFLTVFTATPPASPQLTLTSTDDFCNNNGTAAANPIFCSGPYSYIWEPGGQTTQTATGLSAGVYTVNVGIITGCTTVSDTITVFPGGNILTMSSIPAGGCTAIITASATGGAPPFTYLWSDGETTSNTTAVLVGSYSVNVTDNFGCLVTAGITVGTSITTATTPVLCNGGNTGTATATPTGGQIPYTYAWSDASTQTTTTATGLSAGTYTVTVTDNNGCIATATAAVNQPAPLGGTAAIWQKIACEWRNGQGQAIVTGSGGTIPYTYTWSNGYTGFKTYNLTAGPTYTATITDNNGCTATAGVTLTAPAVQFSAILTVNGCADMATATASGGNAPYTYEWWDSPSTTSTATGLPAGSSLMQVTDNNGCDTTIYFTVTLGGLSVSASQTNVMCNGGTGTATANETGGATPYTYAWSDGSSQTTATANGLTAGTYSVNVTDNNGCTGSASVSITQPNLLSAFAATSANVSCNLGNNGAATASPTGGTTPYTYSWSDGSSQTTATATGLTAGTYTVGVTDNNGCTSSATATITQPTLLGVTANTTSNVSCHTSGSVSSSPSGGTMPYTYAWTGGGGTNVTATGLAAGTYTITVTDNNNCTATAPTIVTQPAGALGVTASTATNVTCNGGSNGSVFANTPTGGTPPYTYAWSDASSQTTVTATGLVAGTYTLTVTDNNGCTAPATTSVTQPPALFLTAIPVTNVSCFSGNDGSATATATGGNTPYTYSWSGGGGTNASATGLAAGTYTVTVTDGCAVSQTTTVPITQPNPLGVPINPTGVTCNGLSNGSAAAAPSGGTAPYTYSWTGGGGTNANATGLSIGTYTVTVTDNNGCINIAPTIITQPALLMANTGIPKYPKCNGGSGTDTVHVSGGTIPYTYAWSPSGGSSATGTNLVVGAYTVTVTDNNGCFSTANTTITQPTQISAVIPSETDVTCNGLGNGKATGQGVGGTKPYTYSWSDGSSQTTAMATSLNVGTYTVTVTDNKGCFSATTTTVNQPTVLTASANTTANVPCNGGNTGSAVASQTGGTSPYTYSWTGGGGTNINAAGLASGTYTVTVTDNNGCISTANPIVVTQPAPFAPVACCSGTIIQGHDTTIIVTGRYIAANKWESDPSDSSLICLHSLRCDTVKVTPLVNTTYTVTITDTLGCETTQTITIVVDIPCFNPVIPNVFTPKNPGSLGLDDKFYIKTKNIDSWSLHIYDRWGKELYSSSNQDEYWGGTTPSGGAAPDGVYYYIINATCQGNTYKKEGFVQLIR